jgi:hypothetical protein
MRYLQFEVDATKYAAIHAWAANCMTVGGIRDIHHDNGDWAKKTLPVA